MKKKMKKYKKDNKRISDMISVKSKRSNRSYRSYKSAFSRKTHKSIKGFKGRKDDGNTHVADMSDAPPDRHQVATAMKTNYEDDQSRHDLEERKSEDNLDLDKANKFINN